MKIFPGIIVRQHHTNQKQKGLLREQAVRRVKEGTSAVLLQSGLNENWWADSVDIQDLLSDRKTPYERRFGTPFNGPVIPFGPMVETSPYFCERLRSKSLARFFFLVYALHAGGIWKGDALIADIEELEQMDASEIHARRSMQRKC